MKIETKATNLELTENIKLYLNKKILSLDKFLVEFEKDKEAKAKVELGKTTAHHRKGNVFRAEINLDLGEVILRAVSLRDDLYAAIVEVKDKLQREIKRYKSRLENK